MPREYTEKDWVILADAVIASCSIPMVLPPHPVPDARSPSGVRYCGDGGMYEFTPVKRALRNPVVGHIDVIVSVGSRELRVLPTPLGGASPSLENIGNSMMEGFYQSTDRVQDEIDLANALVFYKTQSEEHHKAVPSGERKRLTEAANCADRQTYVTARVVRPTIPVSLTMTGAEESISRNMWDAGIRAVDYVLAREHGVPVVHRDFVI